MSAEEYILYIIEQYNYHQYHYQYEAYHRNYVLLLFRNFPPGYELYEQEQETSAVKSRYRQHIHDSKVR